ncbi:MAG: hypothetical protein LBQ24_06300 [Candidatus Peribacteria bacterium]|nr:hypothetical protein [Candidatus Peribacteria bacterium]
MKSFLVSFSLSSLESALGRVIFKYTKFLEYQNSNVHCKRVLNRKKEIIKSIIIPIIQSKSLKNHQFVTSNQVHSNKVLSSELVFQLFVC